MSMKLFDVTRQIRAGMPVYPGDPEVAIERVLSLAGGAPANVSALRLGSHTGTHVDAPAHLREGAPGTDELPLEMLIGPARLYEVVRSGLIDVPDFAGLDLGACPRLLLKVGSTGPGKADGLTVAAARLLVRTGIRLVGLEGESVDGGSSTGLPAHRILLDAGVIILEGLDLSTAPSGMYELFCLPLKIQGCDGAPARVVLRAAD
jgi:arylformamidase